MTITINATPGNYQANSYMTEAEATAYLEAKPGFSALWTAMDQQTRAAMLVESTRCLDRLGFIGNKLDPYQPLQFPRAILPVLLDGTGRLPDWWVNPGSIPPELKWAQGEMIMLIYHQGTQDGSLPGKTVASMSMGGSLQLEFDPSRSEIHRVSSGTLEGIRAVLRYWIAGGGENSISFTK